MSIVSPAVRRALKTRDAKLTFAQTAASETLMEKSGHGRILLDWANCWCFGLSPQKR